MRRRVLKTLKADKNFTYARKRIKRGDFFKCALHDAVILVTAKLAHYPVSKPKPAPRYPDVQALPKVQRERRSKIKALRAEYEYLTDCKPNMDWDVSRLEREVCGAKESADTENDVEDDTENADDVEDDTENADDVEDERSEIEELRENYKRLANAAPDRRWGVNRLEREIGKLRDEEGDESE
jgi:predicted RNase H-like nuclease (RuvC/YqgF family)